MRIQTTLFAALASLVPLTVQAVPITYTFEASAVFTITDASGSLHQYGNPDPDGLQGHTFTVTMNGDTQYVNTSQFGDNVPSIKGLSARFVTEAYNNNAPALNAYLSSLVYVFSNRLPGVDAIGFGITVDLLNLYHNPSPNTHLNYDLISAITVEETYPDVGAPSPGGIQWDNISYAGGGVITMQYIDSIKFTAVLTGSNGGGNGGNNGGGGNNVPEPTTLAILGLGLVGLLATRRRASKSSVA